MTCSSLYGKAGLKHLERDLEFLDGCGLLPEIYLPGELLDSLTEEDISRMESWRDQGRDLTFHAPFVDLAPGGFDRRVLEVTKLRFDQVMKLAARVGPRHIVFHPGFDEFRFAFREELWLENSRRVWGGLMETAVKINTRVCLENVFDRRPDHLVSLREDLGKELGFCFDTGHYLIFSSVPLDDWIDALGDGLFGFHLHDNDGSMDLHRPVGEGAFDFRSLCCRVQDLGLDPVVVLEHHTAEETVRSLENFRHLICES